MATTTTAFIYNTLGEAVLVLVQAMNSQAANVIRGVVSIVDVSVIDWNGAQAIAFEINNGTDSNVSIYAATYQESGQDVEAFALLSQSGLSIVMSQVAEPDPSPVSAAALIDYWTTWVIPAKQSVISELTGVTVTPSDEDEVSDPSSYFTTKSWSTKVTGRTQAFYVTDTFRAFVNPSDLPESVAGFATPDQILTTIVSAPVDTTKIVDAINEISNQDVEASFNQGQTVYSVKARVTAGP